MCTGAFGTGRVVAGCTYFVDNNIIMCCFYVIFCMEVNDAFATWCFFTAWMLIQLSFVEC